MTDFAHIENTSRKIAGIVCGVLSIVIASVLFREHLIDGGGYYAFDLLSSDHWAQLWPNITGWYNGQNDLALSLILQLAFSPFIILFVGLVTGLLASGKAFVIFRAPVVLVYRILAAVGRFLLAISPVQLVRKPVKVPRVVFDDEDIIDLPDLPGRRAPSFGQSGPESEDPDDETPQPLKPLDIQLGQPAATPRTTQEVTKARTPNSSPSSSSPSPETATASKQDDEVPNVAHTGDPLAGLLETMKKAKQEKQDGEGTKIEDADQQESGIMHDAQADELKAQLRLWLDRNGWTALVDIWVDSSRFLGAEAVRPVGCVPLVAASAFEIFLLQVIDLEGQTWETEDPAADAKWISQDGQRSMPSPLSIASDNLTRFMTHHGALLTDYGGLDVQALTLTINGDIADVDALEGAWVNQADVLWTHVDGADLTDDGALDEILGQDFGEAITVEDRAADGVIAALRRDSRETAKLHEAA